MDASQETPVTPPRNEPPLPGEHLDLDPMPPLRPGRCNWCGGALPKPRQPAMICCSRQCRKGWDSFLISVGRQMAVRAIYGQYAKTRRHTGQTPKWGRRSVFGELDRMSRRAFQRLRDRWKLMEGS